MNQPPQTEKQTGKRIVSKGEYANVRKKWRFFDCLAGILLGLMISTSSGGNPPSKASAPISLCMTLSAPFSASAGWKLNVSADGMAHLTIDTYPSKQYTFHVTTAQMSQLRKIVLQERFFTLSTQYGDRVPDGDARTLTIQQGQQSKSVQLFYFNSTVPKREEIKRALRIWKMGETWIREPDAKKMQPYDQHFLEDQPHS